MVSAARVARRYAALSDEARCAPGGMCFVYADNWWTKGSGNTDNDLVAHGQVRLPIGITGPHAWIERASGRIMDWQTANGVWGELGALPDPSYEKRGWPKREFYRVFQPKRVQKYRAEDAMLNAIRAMKHGPWKPNDGKRLPIIPPVE